MPSAQQNRYNDVAISFHWLMAILIIGMLAVGKFMVSLETDDALRFTLTQWHKTFGVSILVLAFIRLAWRLTHRAPAHPDDAPLWEKLAAHASHILLYLLLFIVPFTGWMLVSASPLNIPTLLFNVIEWPHLPWLANSPDKEAIAGRYHLFHEIASGVLFALIFVHAGAALKHHFINKDSVLRRMLPNRYSNVRSVIMRGVALSAVLAVGLVAYASLTRAPVVWTAGSSQVGFVADVTGDATLGIFTNSSVALSLDSANPENSTLAATVSTAGIESDNFQMTSSLPESDWFDTANYPEAQFASTKIESTGSDAYRVTGDLTIKDTTRSHSFSMQVVDQQGSSVVKGEFSVNRLDYKLGIQSQPDDDYVGMDVLIQFQFALNGPEE